MASRLLNSILLLGLVGVAWGQQADVPPGDEKPFPRPEADGPTSFVTSAAISPDGKTLYVAGWDKIVHVWRLNEQGQFTLDREATYRVPIGPGLEGSLNALALSSDGIWLAVAGNGMARDSMSFRNVGFLLKRTPASALRDRGVIYVFNTKTRAVKVLRGHEGKVVALGFAAATGNEQAPLLVSAAQEFDEARDGDVGSLRVWNVDKEASLATLRDLPKSNVLPGLAVWQTGAKLQAGVSWDDGTFRVWEVDKGAQGLQAAPDGRSNNSVAYLANFGQVLTGSFANQKGWLQGWKLPAGGAAPQYDKAMLVSFPPLVEAAGTTYFFPRALTLFASKAGAAPDHAAVILRGAQDGKNGRVEDDRLQIVRIDKAGKLTAVLPTPVIVARGGGTQPVLSAGGRHLVFAGNRNHDVLVFAIDDLLQGGQPKPQTLRSVAETIRYAGFAKKGNDRGLVLNPFAKKGVGGPTRSPVAGDLVFDFANRKLLTDPAGWQGDSPAAGDWKLTQKESTLFAYDGDKLASKITLRDNQQVTDYAVLPGNPPLLALASHNQGAPELALYNLLNGQMIQLLIGHTDRIRSVSFSADGKLLASAAEDQTVSIWTLADFAKVQGRNGTIPGLRLRDADNKTVVVFEVAPDSPAQGKLKEGDAILGIVEAGKLKPIQTEKEFFQAVWQIAPNQPITFRTAKGGDVAIVVSQGVETRNPLFSLFLTRGIQAAARDWIGWSPTGPYDVSRADAERHLGWHINTGKAEAPTRFAAAGQYKQEYYRPDVLKHLVAQGNLARALEEWDRDNKIKKEGKKLPEPQINLRLTEAGPDPLRKDGEVVVRETPKTLRLAIDNFAADDVGAVTWTVTGLAAEPRAFAAAGKEYTADVSKLPWQRGSWKVRVEVQTQEDTPRKYTHDLQVRYQPPPPAVTGPAGRQVVEKDAFSYKATVKPGAAGQDVQVRLTHRHGDKDIVSEVQGNQIDKALKLQPGDNLIEVVAVNKGVPAEYQELETARQVLVVTYQPPVPDPTPIVTLEAVAPQGSRVSPALPIVPGRPIVVDTNKVIVRGKIAATKNLTKADLFKDKDAARPLAKFAADKGKDFTIAEELTLVPGTQQFRIRAQTGKSEPADASVAIVFRPPLPQVVLTAPQTGLIVYEGKDPASVEVRYQVVGYNPEYPFQTSVLVNDKAEPKIPVALDEKSRTLSAKVPLAHGDNRIQVRLKNKYDVEESADDIVVVRYLKPPRIAKLDGPAESDKSLVDLTASVESSLPLAPVVDAEVSNAATGTRRRISTYDVVKGDKGWTVNLKDVPLEVGSNEVRLLVSNSDARSLEPATRTVVYKKTPPPPAEVEILDPRDNVTVTEREQTVTFRVASKSALRRLDLVQQGAVQLRQAIDVTKLKANKDGLYEVKLALKLAGVPAGKVVPVDPTTLKSNPQGFLEGVAALGLVNGTNRLRVEAVNEGGQTDTSVVVNVFSMPVRLVIDRIEARGGKGAAVQAENRGEGRIAFAPVEQGRVMLQGRVLWDREKDDQLKQINQVQVFVNGLRQPAVALADPAAANVRERTFQAPLSLTGKDNAVEVTLPGLKVEGSTRQKFTVACQAPEAQRLHLLIVGIDEQNERALSQQVLSGLHADPSSIDWEQRRFKLPNFAEGRLYPPLVGYVRPGQVLTELRRIKDEIDLLSRAGATSDVVMVYFAGQKAQQGQENYCLTSVSQHVPDLRRSALSFGSLETCLADTLGAQVVLMNVNQTGESVGAGGSGNYLQESRVGLVCYEWTDRTSPPPASLQLPRALEEAMQKSTTLGEVARRLDEIARGFSSKSPVLVCNENITRGHQLTVMPIGAKGGK